MDGHRSGHSPPLTADAATPRLRSIVSLAEGIENLSLAGGLGVLTRSFAEQVAATTAMLVISDEETGLAPIRAAWGLNLDTLDAAVRPGEGAVGRLLQSGRAGVARLESPDGDPIADARHGNQVVATVGAPVRSPSGLIGALCAGLSRTPNAERAQLVWAARSYASVAALCLDGSSLLNALIQAARRDPLTGCLNYGALRDGVRREVSRSERHGRPLACSFFDLDGFKELNDRRGHLEGNRALAAAAAALRSGVRTTDLVGRYGGDEFVVVLPDTDAGPAMTMSQRLRVDIRHATEMATGAAITASVGVANWTPGCSAEELLEQADNGLRMAKLAGGGVIPGERSGAGRAGS